MASPAPEATSTFAVQTRKLAKTYLSGDDHLQVLADVDLDIRRGEFVSIMGPSGSGKSTLLNLVGLLDVPTSGAIRLLGTETHRMDGDARALMRRRSLGFVFQSFNLMPRMSALGNVMLPLAIAGVPRRERLARARSLLESVGLGDRLKHRPSQLSGGQKQRVAIARALCMEPKVLLFDEPTSALDPELIGEVLRVMEDLAHEGTTMIVVTHEMHFAEEAADRVVFMENGVVIEQGPPEQVLNNPRHAETSHFLRRFLDE